MRAVVKTAPGPGNIEVREVERPRPGAGEVLVRVQTAAICGSDLHIYDWDPSVASRMKLPHIIGHEFCGHIEEVGPGVQGLSRGDYVSAEGHLSCGRCYLCRTGSAHICRSVRSLGFDAPGCFADHVVIPASNIWKNDPSLPPEVASIQDPLGNAVHTVFSADVPGRRVAIYGCGPIGLMAITICRAVGAAEVFAVEPKSGYRQKLARELGAHHVITSGDAADKILELTGGEGVDEVLEMAGHEAALKSALRAVRPGGGVHLLGLYPSPVTLDLTGDVIFRALRLHGIYGRRMYDTWYRMAGLLRDGKLNLKPIITHSYPLPKFVEAMEKVKSGACGKVVVQVE